MTGQEHSSKLPRVVAMVPAYNGAGFIERMLESLAAQSYGNLHVLISDDRSTDETVEICRRFASERSNVTLVAQEVNLGWVGNSNYLLGAAEGEYAFFAFHDDELSPAYVEELVHALIPRPDAVVSFSDVTVKADDGRFTERSFESLTGVERAIDRGKVMIRGSGNWWIPFRGLVRTSAYRTIGGLRRHRLGERQSDWFWLLALSLRGPFIRVPKLLYTKHKRPEGVAASWSKGLAMRLIVFLTGIQEVLRSPLALMDKVRLVAYGAAIRLPLLKALVERK